MHNKRSGHERYNRERMLYKTSLCVIGIVVLVVIAFTYKTHRLKEDKAPYVQVKEVFPFIGALSEINEEILTRDIIDLQNHFKDISVDKERYLTFGELKDILQVFPVESYDLTEDYKSNSWSVGLDDWNFLIEKMTDKYGKGIVRIEDTLLLGMSEQIVNEKGKAIGENEVYTGKELLYNRYWNIGEYLFSNVRAVVCNEKLLTVTGYAKKKGKLENVYFSDISNDRVHLFYNGYHLNYPISNFEGMEEKYESGKNLRIIADMVADKGKLKIADEKEEYIHGRVLQVSNSTMEIEGYGRYKTDENMQIYREYGEVASLERQDIRIGYSYTDFVVEDGKIIACLVMREEDMDSIRVLIKNSDMTGRYHEKVSGHCNRDMEFIAYEEGVEKERKIIKKGENFTIERNDISRSGKRIKLVPMVLSGEITIDSIDRSSGHPAYQGILEITGEEEGLLIINELLLEDYLCKVVPSEMPSSYPKQALMAQAVCARTYAYGKMQNAGLPQLGAHLDDSAGFQVYNNIEEQALTTEAVKATHNRILEYGGEPIETYYYSTSCGMGSDTAIWHGKEASPEYLQANEIGDAENTQGVSFADAEFTPQSLTDEEVFHKWIHDVKDSHYESQEGWYRWSYQVNKIDVSRMEEVLRERFAINPNLILTQDGEGYKRKEITSIGKITDIQITKRLPGGIADELLITGTKAVIKVISELNIRYVLADGMTKVKRQTLDEADASSTLPSAFIALETDKKEGVVSGYKIIGGGFGHGVGMSQNGAKNMAREGMDCEAILTFFYPGTTLKTLKPKGES